MTDCTAFRGTIVDGAFVNCTVLMFLDKVTDNFDALTTMIQKGLFGRISSIPLATCEWFLFDLLGNDYTINISPSVVRTNTYIFFLGGIVLFFTKPSFGGFLPDISSSLVLVPFNNCTAASSSKL